MVQISETLEGAFPAFRCRVNVVLLDPHTAITRDLLDSEGICASFTKPGQKRVAQAVYHALIRKVQMRWRVVLGCRDHCEKFDGSTFSSLWYVCGVCFGLFTEFFEFDW